MASRTYRFGSPRRTDVTERTVEMDKQAVTRCNKRTRHHPFHTRWLHQHPVLHDLWQQIQADVLPYASTPALAHDVAKIHYSELATGQALLQTHPNFHRSVVFLFSSEEYLPVRFRLLSFDGNHSFNRGICATCAARELTVLISWRVGFQVATMNSQMLNSCRSY